MTKGDTTTIRESSKPEQKLQKIIKRNATSTELSQAQVQQVGRTFEADGHTYEIERFRIDTIHRLIAIGKLKKENKLTCANIRISGCLLERKRENMSIEQHAFPGYEEIWGQLDYAAKRGFRFSAAYCQTLLETAETYALDVQILQQRNDAIEPLLLEVLVHLKQQPHFNKKTRLNLIYRAERALKYNKDEQDDQSDHET